MYFFVCGTSEAGQAVAVKFPDLATAQAAVNEFKKAGQLAWVEARE